MVARDVVIAFALATVGAVDVGNDLVLGVSVTINVVMTLLTLFRERRIARLEGQVDALLHPASPPPSSSSKGQGNA